MMRRRLAAWLLGIMIIAAGGLVCWAVAYLPYRWVPPLSRADAGAIKDVAARLQATDSRAKLRNDMRVSMVQTLTGVAVAGGLFLTYRTLRLNRDGQLTDRFTRAIDQLGQDDKQEVVLGSIYALHRIARDSNADRAAIVSVLAAYVRHKAPFPPPPEGTPANAVVTRIEPFRDRLPTVQVALTAIHELRYPEGADLRDTDLRRADLEEADMRKWRLRGARLQGARLRAADLRGADLHGASLDEAEMCGADLRDLDLSATTLAGADLSGHRSNTRTRWPQGFSPPGS
jgi:hypothetical protein